MNRLDNLIIGAVIFIAMLTFAILTKTSVWIALCIAAATTGVMWAYFKRLKSKSETVKPRLREDDISRVRGEALEELGNAIPRAIVVINRKADIVHANEAAKALLSANIVGKPFEAYLRTTAVKSHLETAFSGEVPPSLSVRLVQPTERFLDVDFSSAISILPSDKRADVVFAVLADRTQTNKERERRADFLANASHELKTPIASLKGYIETLRGHAKDDPQARDKFLGIMSEQSERMERLVNDLLSLRRIESSEHIPPSEIAELRKALDAARDSLDLAAQQRDIDLHVDLPDSETANTSGKTDECIQLFLNLLENATKLSPKGSRVIARLERLPKWTGDAFATPIRTGEKTRRIVNLAPLNEPVWRITITDQGPGFFPEHLPRIGERFYRVAGDLPTQEKGTGLGLAIVKHIVMRHRAGLFVRSLHSRESEDMVSGTSFSVVFKALEIEN